MSMQNWSTLLYGRNEHKVVNQLHSKELTLSLDTKEPSHVSKSRPRQGSCFRFKHCPLLLVLLENFRLCFQMEATKALWDFRDPLETGAKTREGGLRGEAAGGRTLGTLTLFPHLFPTLPQLPLPALTWIPAAASGPPGGALRAVALITSTAHPGSSPGTAELQENMQAPRLAGRLPSRTWCLPVSLDSPAATPHTQPSPSQTQQHPGPCTPSPEEQVLLLDSFLPSTLYLANCSSRFKTHFMHHHLQEVLPDCPAPDTNRCPSSWDFLYISMRSLAPCLQLEGSKLQFAHSWIHPSSHP